MGGSDMSGGCLVVLLLEDYCSQDEVRPPGFEACRYGGKHLKRHTEMLSSLRQRAAPLGNLPQRALGPANSELVCCHTGNVQSLLRQLMCLVNIPLCKRGFAKQSGI